MIGVKERLSIMRSVQDFAAREDIKNLVPKVRICMFKVEIRRAAEWRRGGVERSDVQGWSQGGVERG